MRGLTLLNESGDFTVTWEEGDDDAMVELIRRKMEAGVTFYIIATKKDGQPRRGAVPKPLKEADAAAKHRSLVVKDEDLAKFVLDGKGSIVPTVSLPEIDRSIPAQRLKAAEDAKGKRVVGTRARAGG